MKKLKYRAIIALRAVVFIIPTIVIVASDFLEKGCYKLSDKLPDPQKYS